MRPDDNYTNALGTMVAVTEPNLAVTGQNGWRRPAKVVDVEHTSVHLVCGIWGTLAVGIFSTNPDHTFMKQLIGVGVYAAFTLVMSFALFALTKVLMGLRVDAEEETGGLDFGEHGMHAYDLGRSAPARGTELDAKAIEATAFTATKTVGSAT